MKNYKNHTLLHIFALYKIQLVKIHCFSAYVARYKGKVYNFTLSKGEAPASNSVKSAIFVYQFAALR